MLTVNSKVALYCKSISTLLYQYSSNKQCSQVGAGAGWDTCYVQTTESGFLHLVRYHVSSWISILTYAMQCVFNGFPFRGSVADPTTVKELYVCARICRYSHYLSDYLLTTVEHMSVFRPNSQMYILIYSIGLKTVVCTFSSISVYNSCGKFQGRVLLALGGPTAHILWNDIPQAELAILSQNNLCICVSPLEA